MQGEAPKFFTADLSGPPTPADGSWFPHGGGVVNLLQPSRACMRGPTRGTEEVRPTLLHLPTTAPNQRTEGRTNRTALSRLPWDRLNAAGFLQRGHRCVHPPRCGQTGV